MQSQQKRVKWSRGETAEALEERTDTGITQASVELMENCIPDIYGNISRRPGLKPIPVSSNFYTDMGGYNYLGFGMSVDKIIPFYFTENDFYLIGIRSDGAGLSSSILRIKNGEIVAKKGLLISSPCKSYAQQNNYMIISTEAAIYKLQIDDVNGTNFNITLENWLYDAGWYAPYGTKTKRVDRVNIPGLEIQGPKGNYIYSDPNTGLATTYSTFDTGLTGIGNISILESNIPVGSIISLPNMGSYIRVEGFYESFGTQMFMGVTFDSVGMGDSNPGPGTGKVCMARSGQPILRYYNDGVLVSELRAPQPFVVVACSASGTGYSRNYFFVSGGGTRMWTGWTNQDISGIKTYIYGSLLTPIADENGKEQEIEVEYGYESLQPASYNPGTTVYPHPNKFVFYNQRLWAGGWSFNQNDEYALVIGSHIARYNDFKNDYNQANEPITLDILTQFKEKILHLIDYNGLKIMTDSYEYAYDGNNGVQKQSANGSFEYCEPIIFDSLCLYIDSTGCQVKAMQYEFQTNIFNSSTINQLAPHDLVWYPRFMAQYEDKYNSTGKYLFMLNQEDAVSPIAVCNFVPTNQAEIWSRWKVVTNQTIKKMVNLKNGVIFFGVAQTVTKDNDAEYPGQWPYEQILIPMVLDFDANCDFETTVINNQVIFNQLNVVGATNKSVAANTQIDVYSNGEYVLTATTNSLGYITEDISQYTNVTVGFKINATIRSHPIDVGGKTKTIKKRIGKTVLSVHNTESGAITVNGKTGYMNPQKDKINFYGVTGMKDEIKYIVTNKNGARFTIESMTMNVEYGTLIS